MEQASTSNATGRQTRKPKTGQECSAINSTDTAAASAVAARAHSKTGKVLALLGREEGATLDEMVEATGWLPHTTRAALTGLSADLLRMGIACRLQEKQFGGLSRSARQVLQAGDKARAAKSPQRKLTPGTQLVRDWHGVGHNVTVLEEGFHYDERHWPSLTATSPERSGRVRASSG